MLALTIGSAPPHSCHFLGFSHPIAVLISASAANKLKYSRSMAVPALLNCRFQHVSLFCSTNRSCHLNGPVTRARKSKPYAGNKSGKVYHWRLDHLPAPVLRLIPFPLLHIAYNSET
jgi:hypothetical protein